MPSHEDSRGEPTAEAVTARVRVRIGGVWRDVESGVGVVDGAFDPLPEFDGTVERECKPADLCPCGELACPDCGRCPDCEGHERTCPRTSGAGVWGSSR